MSEAEVEYLVKVYLAGLVANRISDTSNGTSKDINVYEKNSF